MSLLVDSYHKLHKTIIYCTPWRKKICFFPFFRSILLIKRVWEHFTKNDFVHFCFVFKIFYVICYMLLLSEKCFLPCPRPPPPHFFSPTRVNWKWIVWYIYQIFVYNIAVILLREAVVVTDYLYLYTYLEIDTLQWENWLDKRMSHDHVASES